MDEIWKRIPGYEGFYEASNLGRIRSLHTHSRRNPDGILSQSNLRDYKTVVLCNAEGRGTKMVHRLVAMAFLGMPSDSKRTVNHKDMNKSNNRPENLEWLSLAENIRHASKIIPRLRGEANKSKLTENDVRTMRAMYAAGGVTLNQLSEKFGVSGVTCHNIIRRRKWAHVE